MIDHDKLTADLKAVQADVRLRAFIADTMSKRFVETVIVEKLWAALILDRDPIVAVLDGDEGTWTPVYTLDDLNMQVFNLDEAHLKTKSGAGIFLVMGQDWDMICDYSVRLEDDFGKKEFTKLQQWIDRNN